MDNNPRILLALFVILLLSACNSPEVYSSEPLPESKTFMAEGVDNPIIQLLWLELPDAIKPGLADARLFIKDRADRTDDTQPK